ncbi:MAG TPA: hypothetical protein VMF08_12485 [Candidatus Sulfotelmatobacter sp.]|nr:hypothetical protein [Candidatus Sulfotelmatobacter sp.]
MNRGVVEHGALRRVAPRAAAQQAGSWSQCMRNRIEMGSMVRIVLIIGASACFVIGGVMVAEDVVYDIYNLFDLLLTLIPFAPLLLMAPRYKNGNVIYGFTAALEAIIIVANHFMVLR